MKYLRNREEKLPKTSSYFYICNKIVMVDYLYVINKNSTENSLFLAGLILESDRHEFTDLHSM